jgi:hypothetical protein
VDSTQISSMRLKQAAVTNMLLLAALIAFFLIINTLKVTFAQFYFAAAILVFFQGAVGLLKRNSTKSIFPIFEKVALYEKEKMGSEWVKYKRAGYIWSVVLSCMFLVQSYTFNDSLDQVFQLELFLMFIVAFSVLILMNIHLIIHFRKVDGASSPAEFKGYTRRTYTASFWAGILMASIIIFVFISTFL